MLEEGNQRGADTDNLMRGNIHVIDFIGCNDHKVRVVARGDTLGIKFVKLIERRIRLGNGKFILSIRRQVNDLIRNERLNKDRGLVEFS